MPFPSPLSAPNGSDGSARPTVQVRRQPVGDLLLTLASYPPGATLPQHTHEPAAIIHLLEGDYREAFQSQAFSLGRGHQLFRPSNAVHSDVIGKRGARCF